MTRIAFFGLALLLSPAAWAETTGQPPAPPAPASQLPLAAMRHQQPRAAEVNQREAERFGQSEVQRQRRQRAEVDQLYDEIMRRSAPAQGRQ